VQVRCGLVGSTAIWRPQGAERPVPQASLADSITETVWSLPSAVAVLQGVER
jgi:hypothetical protein